MYHRPNDVKATLSRSEALKSKKAKADPRPASPVSKSKKAGASAPSKAPPSTEANRRAKPAVPAASKPAASKPVASKPAASKPVASKPVASKPLAEERRPPAPTGTNRGVKAAPAATTSKAKPGASASSKHGSSKAVAAVQAPAPSPVKPTDSAPPPSAKRSARKSVKEAAGVSTDAVARRTGKTWDDWFEVLDSAGAAALDQRGIIAILAQKHGIGPWWQQMIAVGYESLRAKTEKPAPADDFQISEACTLSAPIARVFKLWNDASERARWLADDRFVVKSATPGKALRARWGKGNSQVTVSFQERAGKTEVAVEHQHIESRTAAEQMKAYWQKKLGLLDDTLAERR